MRAEATLRSICDGADVIICTTASCQPLAKGRRHRPRESVWKKLLCHDRLFYSVEVRCALFHECRKCFLCFCRAYSRGELFVLNLDRLLNLLAWMALDKPLASL